LTGGLGGKEGLEVLLLIIFGNAGAVVFEAVLYFTVHLAGADFHFGLVVAVEQRFLLLGIIEQVQQHPSHLLRHDFCFPKCRVKISGQGGSKFGVFALRPW
jgi:hypothetical protein